MECRQALTSLSNNTYKWLENINRHESENGAVADHVKIATIINHLRGPINQPDDVESAVV
eukprot:1157583-Amphidinium_carterae.4